MLLQDCGCGCNQSVVQAPCTSTRCRSSLANTSIAELLWLSGLDENLCDKFQRLSDILHLRDCAGNRISIDTPIVMCSDFQAQLCNVLVGLENNGEANQFTQLVGADCKLYTIPIPVNPSETPNSATNTNTANVVLSSTLDRDISVDVVVSGDAGNILEIHANGLYAPESDPIPSVCTQIGSFPVGSDAIPGTVLIGADCNKHTLYAPTPYTVTDTSSIDLTLSGTNISANLRLDPDSIGRVTSDGLEITCTDVLACAPNVTVNDSESINLSISGQSITADLLISSDVNNHLEIRPNGLYVDICAGLLDGLEPQPAVIENTVLIGADCNRYTIPAQNQIVVQDTTSVNLSLASNTLQADVNIQPGTLLSLGTQGLQVTCEAVQDCVYSITNNFFSYNDASNLILFNPSSDANNAIVNGTDGRPYVADTEVTLIGTDTNCIDITIIESPNNTFEISADPIISAIYSGYGCNGLVCDVFGLSAPPNSTGNSGTETSGANFSGELVALQVENSTVVRLDITNPSDCRSAILIVNLSWPIIDITAVDGNPWQYLAELRLNVQLAPVSTVATYTQNYQRIYGEAVHTSRSSTETLIYTVPPSFTGYIEQSMRLTGEVGDITTVIMGDFNPSYTLITI